MTAHRAGLPPMPQRIAKLPVDARGYPIPFFVSYVDDVPDFRLADPAKLTQCTKEGLCWLCGQRLGAYGVFVVGPMCAVNRTTSEPPSHRECAEFAVQACPFLVHPDAHRRDANLPDDRQPPAGEMITRNPGVTVLWVTKDWSRYQVHQDGRTLIRLGDPSQVISWCQGRTASEDEIFASIETGLPALREICDREANVISRTRAHAALTQDVVAGCRALGVNLAHYTGARL